VETTNFNSQDIKSATYDEITSELYVRFTNGDYYVYYDVLSVDYIGFLSSEDHSQYIKEQLSDKYDKRKL
jgi:hypothetical protein